ncbi:hypothetical protein EES44_18145 [Streptomyces sp. ADI96-15]|nr:hypothetical protein EES44_18145 [Streptomyces sp. ADI96-15]
MCGTCSPITVAGPRRISTGFLVRRRLFAGPSSHPARQAKRAAPAPVSRFGPHEVLPVGSLAVTADLLMLALWRDHVAVLAPGTFLLGAGVGAAYAVMPLPIVRHVPPSETAGATSFNQVLRTVGRFVGSAAVSAVLLARTPAADNVPEGSACTTALLTTAGAAFLGFVMAVVLPPRRRSAPTAAEPVVHSARRQMTGPMVWAKPFRPPILDRGQ